MIIKEIKFIQEGDSGYPELQMLLDGNQRAVPLRQNLDLELTDIQYLEDEGRDLLQLKINGREALISLEQKPTLVASGVISVGDEFADILPDIRLANQSGSMNSTLDGCCGDPALIRVWVEFADTVTS